MRQTASQQLTTIKNKLASVLPALLTSAGLTALDEYVIEAPEKSDTKSIAVYLDGEDDNTDEYSLKVIIQLQGYRIKNLTAYHSVIFQALKDHITADLLKLNIRDGIFSDTWPLTKNNMTSYGFYGLEFLDILDDCE